MAATQASAADSATLQFDVTPFSVSFFTPDTRMVSRFVALSRNEHLRIAIATVAVLAVLVVITDATPATIVPMAVILFALVAHDAIDDRYDLPRGSNWVAYGLSVAAVGVAIAVLVDQWWYALALVVPGLWFVLDGATTMRYAPEAERHEFVAEISDDDGSEVMFRMQTLNLLYQHLRDADESRTTAEIAEEVDLTESRVESALGYLESRGQVERTGERYAAVPPRWGRLTPLVDFVTWVPRRLLRPFSRLVSNA